MELTDELIKVVRQNSKYSTILKKLGLSHSPSNKEQLKKLIKEHNLQVGVEINLDEPLGEQGIWKHTTGNQLKQIISESTCWTEVAQKLQLPASNLSTTAAQKHANICKIDYSHFIKKSDKKQIKIRPDSEIFSETSCVELSEVRRRILKQDLIPYICSECEQQPEHNGKPLMLQLKVINEVQGDYRLSNLTFLCPNCYIQSIS